MAKKKSKSKIHVNYKKLGAQATHYADSPMVNEPAPGNVSVAFSFKITGQTAVLNSALEINGDGLYSLDKAEVEACQGSPYDLYGEIMASVVRSQLIPETLADEYGCGFDELTVTLRDIKFFNRTDED